MYVDSPEKPFTVVEWCAGYGGIHLGLKRAIPNLRVIAVSEIEAFAIANLVAKMEAGLMEPAPVWPNLKTFPSAAFANKVDLLVAGYPCQPFSHAGKREGTEDERHLWPYIAVGIRAMRPRFCFFENVEGHITLGLSTVISDLAEMGYQTTWGIFSASEVGAPHQRKRVFILAHSEEQRDEREQREVCRAERRSGGALSWDFNSASDTDELAYDKLAYDKLPCPARLGEHSLQPSQPTKTEGVGTCNGRVGVWPSRPGQPQYDWEPPRVTGTKLEHVTSAGCETRRTERVGEESRGRSWESTSCSSGGQTQSPLGGNSHGSADRLDNAELYESCDNRVDELRLLGNGVVPATAEKAWRVLYERFNLKEM